MPHRASVFERWAARLRGNPSALGACVAGIIAALLIALSALFNASVSAGLQAMSDVVHGAQINDRLRALVPELTKTEAFLQLNLRGQAVGSFSALDKQMETVSEMLRGLEPVMAGLSPQPWSVFRQMQEDWEAVQSQAQRLKHLAAAEFAGESLTASEALSHRFASLRGRASVLQEYLRGWQQDQRLLAMRWRRRVESMAWGLVVGACLLSGFVAWLVAWIWTLNVQAFTWSAERMAAGDCSHRVEVPRAGSLRALAQAINALAERAESSVAQQQPQRSEEAFEEPLEQIDQQV